MFAKPVVCLLDDKMYIHGASSHKKNFEFWFAYVQWMFEGCASRITRSPRDSLFTTPGSQHTNAYTGPYSSLSKSTLRLVSIVLVTKDWKSDLTSNSEIIFSTVVVEFDCSSWSLVNLLLLKFCLPGRPMLHLMSRSSRFGLLLDFNVLLFLSQTLPQRFKNVGRVVEIVWEVLAGVVNASVKCTSSLFFSFVSAKPNLPLFGLGWSDFRNVSVQLPSIPDTLETCSLLVGILRHRITRRGVFFVRWMRASMHRKVLVSLCLWAWHFESVSSLIGGGRDEEAVQLSLSQSFPANQKTQVLTFNSSKKLPKTPQSHFKSSLAQNTGFSLRQWPFLVHYTLHQIGISLPLSLLSLSYLPLPLYLHIPSFKTSEIHSSRTPPAAHITLPLHLPDDACCQPQQQQPHRNFSLALVTTSNALPSLLWEGIARLLLYTHPGSDKVCSLVYIVGNGIVQRSLNQWWERNYIPLHALPWSPHVPQLR